MWKDYNKYKVFKVFMDDPMPGGGGYQLREISRKIKLAPKSVKAYLDQLKKEGLILEEASRIHGYPTYRGNRESEGFRLYKKLDLIASITETGLLEHLYQKTMPDSIVLFGSAARGEDARESDIDIYLEAKQREIPLERYEKQLNRKINITFSERFSGLSKELRNNIINGSVLKGYLKAC